MKARWICQQPHQQLKEELGLDHFKGRSWAGLHRHALMTMIDFPIHLRRNAGGDAMIGQPGAEPIGIVSSVAKQASALGEASIMRAAPL
jgi:hypothetical protein